MREILFRGKKIENGEWIVGNLTIWSDKTTSIDAEPTEGSILWAVVPETVGQYTGLTDKKGKKIFEGDIVKYEYKDFRGEKCAIYLDVQYCEICGVYKPFGDSDDTFASDEVEVIGNVFDNPEMLEVK